jgi:protoheme IX farnesyltransferase
LLFLVIFFWTPPHFWALSLLRSDDYARAGIPMLPVVAGETETRRQILIYSAVLAPVGALPWLLGYAGLLYGATAIMGGTLMIVLSTRLFTAAKNRVIEQNARQLFAFSILYLFVLFAVLLVEQGMNLPRLSW